MDIKLPLNSLNPATLNKLSNQMLTLKVGQQLDGKVLSSELQAGKVTVTLKLGNDTITLQSNNPITVTPGQNLQIQVLKVAPLPEFKVVSGLPAEFKLQPQLNTSAQSSPALPVTLSQTSAQTPTQAPELRLTLLPSAPAAKPELIAPTPQQASAAPVLQTVEFKVVGFDGNKVQLQLVPDATESALVTDPKAQVLASKAAVISIDRSQLAQLLPDKAGSTAAVTTKANTPSLSPSTDNLKIGAHLALEIAKTETGSIFKIMAPLNQSVEQQITSLVKQLLPKHEASPVLLNQLIKDLPQILDNKALPQALKTLAVLILDKLPAQQQLADSNGLKQAVRDTGLLLEAKLAAALDNQELDLKTDFKGNLLKLVHLLKQEVAGQNLQLQNSADTDLLKNLQQKTENTLAKIVLDQLNALPKDENPKQVWNIDIPFLNKGSTETVNMQIQWEQAKHNDNEQTPTWSVNITINPPNLGQIHCTIAYQNNVINTYFKSRQNQTTALINAHLDDLKKQLEASGLKPGHLIAQQGASANKANQPLFTNKLFDEQA
ncbi:MAG: flagellar hook-length control protein FliK [Methylococcales bacterium]